MRDGVGLTLTAARKFSENIQFPNQVGRRAVF
jgi:hypothetical protein